MDNVIRTVIGKLVSGRTKGDKAARAAIEPGVYEVDTTVHVTGKLTVGEDHEIAPTASLLNKEFFAMVLHNAGVTREAAVKAMEEAASEYLLGWTGSEEDKEAAKEARKEKLAEYDPEGKMAGLIDGFKGRLPMVPSKGKTTWKGNFIEVEGTATTEIGEEGVAVETVLEKTEDVA